MYSRQKNSLTLVVKEEIDMLPFLLKKMGGMTKTSVKGLLARRLVTVNGIIQTRHDVPLQTGDKVVINSNRGNIELQHPKLKIIYEDDDFVVVAKQPGLLTVETHKNSLETTAFSILKSYVRKQNLRNSIFIVHRLDRDTSGVLVFAKKKEVQEALRHRWSQLVQEKIYVAVVKGNITEDEGRMVSWLTEDNKNKRVYSSSKDNGGKRSITCFQVLGRCENDYTLVKLSLETGRTNQIRVQLASMGHPVVGDKKYGKEDTPNPFNRLALHALSLQFCHPFNGKIMRFDVPMPREFKGIFSLKHTM